MTVAIDDERHELRELLRETGVLQTDIAARLGYRDERMSRILKGREPVPEGFASSFKKGVREITQERYERAIANVAAVAGAR